MLDGEEVGWLVEPLGSLGVTTWRGTIGKLGLVTGNVVGGDW